MRKVEARNMAKVCGLISRWKSYFFPRIVHLGGHISFSACSLFPRFACCVYAADIFLMVNYMFILMLTFAKPFFVSSRNMAAKGKYF